MRIDITDRKSVMVELSKDDLSKSEITYEQLDYSNPRTRKLVRSILEKIRTETGFFVADCSSLEVEVMPDSFGGCLMIFKAVEQKAAAKAQATVFAAENINNLIDGSREAVKAFGNGLKASLYKNDGSFFLLVSSCSAELSSFLCEYLSVLNADEVTLKMLLEHCECLIDGNALAVLSGKKL